MVPATRETRDTARLFLAGAVASGVLLPAVGVLLTVWTGRRRTAWCFTAVLVVGVVVVAYYGVPVFDELAGR
jgi:hypothetical protein